MMASPALVSEPVDRTALEAKIADALQNDATLIFLDTSLLVWFYRLHEAARQELLDWFVDGRPEGTVLIPQRAIHEFSRHRRNPNVLFPLNQLRTIPKLFEQFRQCAHLVADDEAVKRRSFPDRLSYLKEVDAVHETIKRLLQPVLSTSHMERVETTLIPVINSLAMSGDIFQDVAKLQSEYAARAEIRMPPGFRDLKKGQRTGADLENDDLTSEPANYGANRFGDFAIWREIISYCEALREKPKSIVIITHDVKDDWSYTPLKIIDLDGIVKNNEKSLTRVTVPHPMLIRELYHISHVHELHILTASQLARIATRNGIGTTLDELARAAQVEQQNSDGDILESSQTVDPNRPAVGTVEIEEEAARPIQDAVDDVGAGFGENAAGAPHPQREESATDFLAALPRQAKADHFYAGDAGGSPEIDKEIRALKSSNWYTQNPAVQSVMRLLRDGEGTLLQTFIVGRNIYQAACGTANEAVTVLTSLKDELAQLPETRAQILYAGALCEAYLNRQGEVRPHPKSQQIDGLFALQSEDRYGISVDWLNRTLEHVSTSYLALPARQPTYHEMRIATVDDNLVTAISVGGIDITEPFVDAFTGDPLPPRSQFNRLAQRISRHFAIPDNQFTLVPSFEGIVRFENLQLRDWGPTTLLRWTQQ